MRIEEREIASSLGFGTGGKSAHPTQPPPPRPRKAPGAGNPRECSRGRWQYSKKDEIMSESMKTPGLIFPEPLSEEEVNQSAMEEYLGVVARLWTAVGKPVEAERLAETLIARQIIEIEEAIALLERYRDFPRGPPGERGIIVHDSEGEQRIGQARKQI